MIYWQANWYVLLTTSNIDWKNKITEWCLFRLCLWSYVFIEATQHSNFLANTAKNFYCFYSDLKEYGKWSTPIAKGEKFSMVMMLLGQQDGEHEPHSLKVVMMLFAQINIKVRKNTAWRRFLFAHLTGSTILFSKNKLVNWTFFGHNAHTPKRYLGRKVPALLSASEAFLLFELRRLKKWS